MLQFDREHIWHPYSSITSPSPVHHAASASGCIIKLEDGTELIDGTASWWSAIHGYNHPRLNDAVCKQLESMSHIMFGGFTHKPAIELAKILTDITPDTLQKIFFCDSGSAAVEVSIKMAFQYWLSKEKKEKNRLLAFRGSYHGDTFMAMSVCDPVDGMHNIFSEVLHKNFFAEKPACSFDEPFEETFLTDIKTILSEHHNEIAAMIIEPVLQAAGGMNLYSPHYLKALRELCDEYQVLLIFDEIATGFGHTGKLFALEHAGVSPDIMCIGKALTGGYMSLAAVITSNKVAEGVCEGETGMFMHGPTFMANPLACAVACESIKLLLSYDWQKKVKEIELQLNEELEQCRYIEGVVDVRVLGAVGIVEMIDEVNKNKLIQKFVSKGVWIRPFNNIIYLMPPYIITKEQLTRLTGAICEVLEY